MGFQLPPGFEFDPSDFELIYFYLVNKQTGKPLPMEGFVRDCDLYDERQVLDLFTMMKIGKIKKLFLFTWLKKKSDKGSRIDRTVGKKGTWKGLDRGKQILDKQGNHVGCKKSFDYDNKGSKESGACKMKEYSLDGVSLQRSDLKFKDIVLCQIKMKDRGSKRARGGINVQWEQGAETQFYKAEYETLIDHGCLNNKRIRASGECSRHMEHLSVQNIEGNPAAPDGLISWETHLQQADVEATGSTSATPPSGNPVYDVLDSSISIASTLPLIEAAPRIEQSGSASGENNVSMLEQPCIIQEPTLQLAMGNVGCENEFETPQELHALDEHDGDDVDGCDLAKFWDDMLKDQLISAPLSNQLLTMETLKQQEDGMFTDTWGKPPSCDPIYDLLNYMCPLTSVPAIVELGADMLWEENEVKIPEQQSTNHEHAPDSEMANMGCDDKIETLANDRDEYDDNTVVENLNCAELFSEYLLKGQQLPLKESEIEMLPNTFYSDGLHSFFGGDFLIASQLKAQRSHVRS